MKNQNKLVLDWLAKYAQKKKRKKGSHGTVGNVEFDVIEAGSC